MTHEEHRAFVETGYAPLNAYITAPYSAANTVHAPDVYAEMAKPYAYTVESTEYQPFHRRFVVEIVAQTRFGVEYGCELYKRTDASWSFHNPFTLADGTWMIRGEKEAD